MHIKKDTDISISWTWVCLSKKIILGISFLVLEGNPSAHTVGSDVRLSGSTIFFHGYTGNNKIKNIFIHINRQRSFQDLYELAFLSYFIIIPFSFRYIPNGKDNAFQLYNITALVLFNH